MKSFLFLCLLALASGTYAQTSGYLAEQKDKWGVSYDYNGELKNGKPHGWGIARYASGSSAIRYAGQFENGFYHGKGVLMFKDSIFLAGQWQNGLLNGKGANLTASGAFYVGDFVNGTKNGKGILIYKNNDFVSGSFGNDKINGRALSLWSSGKIMSDNYYENDKRQGPGYQYEAESKKLYKGEWSQDKWVAASEPGYASFLTQAKFVGEADASHILMGPVNDNRFLTDSSYYYDITRKKRYFGKYTNGKLTNGLIIRDDSTRFYGSVNEQGASGYGYDVKFNSYYSEGNYNNDLLNGQIIDFSLRNKSVYFGTAVNGQFTGKAVFINNTNTIFSGDYKEGRFTGNGFRIKANGVKLTGTWEEGEIVSAVSLTDASGVVYSMKPQTFNEALNLIASDYTDYFNNLVKEAIPLHDDFVLSEDTAFRYGVSTSLIKVPGGLKNDIIIDDFFDNQYYSSALAHTTDFAKAKAKYLELGKQLATVQMKIPGMARPAKLIGSLKQPSADNDKTETRFAIMQLPAKYEGFSVWVTLVKFDGFYDVILRVGRRSSE